MSEDVRRIIGANVGKWRKAAGLTQAALAIRMGVDRAYVSGLELGQRNPTAVSLWHLAKALEIDVRQLFVPPKSRSSTKSIKREKASV